MFIIEVIKLKDLLLEIFYRIIYCMFIYSIFVSLNYLNQGLLLEYFLAYFYYINQNADYNCYNSIINDYKHFFHLVIKPDLMEKTMY